MLIPKFNGYEQSDNSDCQRGLICAVDNIIKCEITEEYILNDSLPDVKKLLKLDFFPRITDYSCDSGVLRYAGECRIFALYVSDLSRIRCAELTASFSGKETINACDDQRIILIPRIVRNDSRMLSPRKLSLRLGMIIGEWVFEGYDLSCKLQNSSQDELGSTLRTLSREVSLMSYTTTERIGLPFREEIELDGNLPGIDELICSLIDIGEIKVAVGNQSADIDAAITVRCLYESENGNCVEFSKPFAIRETIEIPDAVSDMSGIAIFQICGIKSSVQNNSYGERRIIELDAEFDLSVHCFQNQSASLVNDAYSTNFEIKYNVFSPELCRFDGMVGTAFSVNHKTARTEVGGERVKEIFSGTILPSEITLRFDNEKKKFIVEGKAMLTMACSLAREESEADGYGREYLSIKNEVPFRGEIECPQDGGHFLIRYPKISRTRFHSDDQFLYADFEVSISMPCIRSASSNHISDISIENESWNFQKESGCIVLFYPDADETLWSVAKHFHSELKTIADANQLEALPDLEIKKEKNLLYIP